MNIAINKEGQKVSAKSEIRLTDCVCPECGEKVIHRICYKKRSHFAHQKDSTCHYGEDKDSKSEWHIRMQDYFPIEAQEYRFVDKETGEVHKADVFLEKENTVIEFQHSPISLEEYKSRTDFHLKYGRRIAWFFDESIDKEKEPQGENCFGRFRLGEERNKDGIPLYDWVRNPRYILEYGPNVKDGEYRYKYSVCVFTGTEGDVFHRIVDTQDGFSKVAFSAIKIQMGESFDVEKVFAFDSAWMNDLLDIVKKANAAEAYIQQMARPQRVVVVNPLANNRPRRRRGRRF